MAAKVKAAAEAKVPGGTVERVETDVDHGSPYEAHVRKADGTELKVLVDKDFKVTAVNTMATLTGRRAAPGGAERRRTKASPRSGKRSAGEPAANCRCERLAQLQTPGNGHREPPHRRPGASRASAAGAAASRQCAG